MLIVVRLWNVHVHIHGRRHLLRWVLVRLHLLRLRRHHRRSKHVARFCWRRIPQLVLHRHMLILLRLLMQNDCLAVWCRLNHLLRNGHHLLWYTGIYLPLIGHVVHPCLTTSVRTVTSLSSVSHRLNASPVRFMKTPVRFARGVVKWAFMLHVPVAEPASRCNSSSEHGDRSGCCQSFDLSNGLLQHVLIPAGRMSFLETHRV